MQALMAADTIFSTGNRKGFGEIGHRPVLVVPRPEFDAPQLNALWCAGHRKLDHRTKATQKGLIDVLLSVVKIALLKDLKSLKQKRDLLVIKRS